MFNINFREGTTRYVKINCKDQAGDPFDFTDYTVQTYLRLNGKCKQALECYLPTAKIGSLLQFTIPAAASVGMDRGVTETRIFNNGSDEVESVIVGEIDIHRSPKPNIVPQEATP